MLWLPDGWPLFVFPHPSDKRTAGDPSAPHVGLVVPWLGSNSLPYTDQPLTIADISILRWNQKITNAACGIAKAQGNHPLIKLHTAWINALVAQAQAQQTDPTARAGTGSGGFFDAAADASTGQQRCRH